jgi:hypothetical protein
MYRDYLIKMVLRLRVDSLDNVFEGRCSCHGNSPLLIVVDIVGGIRGRGIHIREDFFFTALANAMRDRDFGSARALAFLGPKGAAAPGAYDFQGHGLPPN